MKETEVKFEVDDLDVYIQKLENLGAEFIWSALEEAFYFDDSNQNLSQEKKDLRIKTQGGEKAILTFKSPVQEEGGFKVVSQELNININFDDVSKLKDIFSNLGYDEFLKVSKWRQHFEYEDLSIELDKFRDKRFVEIEGTKEDIRNLANELGLDWERSTTQSYKNM